MNIFEILKGKDSDNPILKDYRVEEKLDNEGSNEKKTAAIDAAQQIAVPENIEETFNFVGKALAKSYRRGEISAKELLQSYRKNVAEAETFCTFGYKIQELQDVIRTTHNPALKTKLMEIVKEKKELRQKTNLQNQTTLNKLDMFKKDVLGMGIGLRKVISSMRKCYKRTGNKEALIVSMLLEIEFANENAKRLSSNKRRMAYERKSILLNTLSSLAYEAGWKSGYNEAAGKNASYLVFVYLPTGVQLTWHCNDYTIPQYFDYIADEWDGQVCMTLEKILTYIKDHYSSYLLSPTKMAA